MAQNEQYWIDRANRRMDGYQISAIKQARIINRSYNQTCSYVQSEIAKILRHIGDEDSLAYEYRMRRLNTLLANTRKMMQELYGITLSDTTDFLRSIIPEAYYHTIFDVAQGAGEQPVFSAVNTRLIDKIVNDQWSGKNYSQRIWWNTSKLSEDVQQLLTTAAMSGESIYKTSRRLSERFGESMNNSVRLIRTETTYACNQAEMASYKSLDIDRYKFVATLDTRTSTICQKLDGKVFETKDAQAGKNLPSMHPNCRSTTIPSFEDGMPEIRTARDKDGNRIKVPADMTYPEWYEKYIKPSEGGNGSQKPSAPSKGKDTAKSGNGSQEPQNTLDSKPAEINIPAPDNGKPDYTDTPIPKNVHNSSVDNSGKSSIIESGELESIIKYSDGSQVPKDVKTAIEETVSVIPEHLRSRLEQFVPEIIVEEGRGFSSFTTDNNIILDKETATNSILHELGHAWAKMDNLYEDEEFLAVLADGLEREDWGEVTSYVHPYKQGDYVYILESPKFLTPYQGRVYSDFSDVDPSKPIPLELFQEYISVGFQTFFDEPELLRKKDKKLYGFLEARLNEHS